MKQQPHLQLRKIGSKYMIVNADAGQVNLTEVFTLNETAAQLWQYMSGGERTVEALTEWLCENYEVAEETARKDVERQLAEWKAFGLIE